jgi:hypothetical protein
MAQTSRPTFRPSKQTDCMPEDDPNSNCDVEYDSWPRWGPNHKGAQELQRLYTKGIHNFIHYFLTYFHLKLS